MPQTLPAHILQVLQKIFDETKPVSIFLYGSMSRDDFEKDSDYEVGVLYNQKDKVSRKELALFHQNKNLKLYPFSVEDLDSYNLDTPFPKLIYIRQLIETAVILFGENTFSKIDPPIIKASDLLEEVAFSLGRAYAAVVSSRQQDWIAARDGFTKGLFYGLQVLLSIKYKKIFYSYSQLYNKSKELELAPEYQNLIDHALKVRRGEAVIDIPLLYTNISFLNKVVMPEVRSLLVSGDQDVVRL